MKIKPAKYEGFKKRLELAVLKYRIATGNPMDQKTLGEALGFSKGNVSHWFTGKQLPKQKEIEAIGRLLNAHPGWLLFGQVGTFTTPDGQVYTEFPSGVEQTDHPAKGKRGRKG